ncbi:MAG: hypothetical protein ACSLE2_12795 [Lysobacterales bacterium]
MSRYSQGLQDQAQDILARARQVHRLLECVVPQAEGDPHLQDGIEGVAVLAGQLSEMADSLYSEVSKPTAHELAAVREHLFANRRQGESA